MGDHYLLSKSCLEELAHRNFERVSSSIAGAYRQGLVAGCAVLAGWSVSTNAQSASGSDTCEFGESLVSVRVEDFLFDSADAGLPGVALGLKGRRGELLRHWTSDSDGDALLCIPRRFDGTLVVRADGYAPEEVSVGELPATRTSLRVALVAETPQGLADVSVVLRSLRADLRTRTADAERPASVTLRYPGEHAFSAFFSPKEGKVAFFGGIPAERNICAVVQKEGCAQLADVCFDLAPDSRRTVKLDVRCGASSNKP